VSSLREKIKMSQEETLRFLEKQLLQLEVFLNVEKDTINDFTDKSKVYER